MIRITALLIVAVMLCLPLSGCWNRREMNELAITVGVGIDKIDDQYLVTAQVVDPGEVASRRTSGSPRLPVVVFKERSTSVLEALRKMTTSGPRRIYMAHLRMLVIGEELAREGIANVLDFFSRGHELRTDFFITVTKDVRAETIMKVLTPLEKIPANEMFSSLETSEHYWAPTHGVYLDRLVNELVTGGRNPVLTGIRIVGDVDISGEQENVKVVEPPGKLKYIGFGVFRKDKLIGWLNEDESKGYSYIMGNVKDTVGHVTCPDGGRAILEVQRTKTIIRGKVVNGKPRIDIRLTADGDIAELACKIDVADPASLIFLQNKVAERLKQLMSLTIERAQKDLKSDFLGFGAAIHKSNPKQWKQWKDNWPERFPDVPVFIHVDYKLRRVGTITNSFIRDIKE